MTVWIFANLGNIKRKATEKAGVHLSGKYGRPDGIPKTRNLKGKQKPRVLWHSSYSPCPQGLISPGESTPAVMPMCLHQQEKLIPADSGSAYLKTRIQKTGRNKDKPGRGRPAKISAGP